MKMLAHLNIQRCFNPYNIPNHLVRVGLRFISATMLQRYNLEPNLKACVACRKNLKFIPPRITINLNTIPEEYSNFLEDNSVENDRDNNVEILRVVDSADELFLDTNINAQNFLAPETAEKSSDRLDTVSQGM